MAIESAPQWMYDQLAEMQDQLHHADDLIERQQTDIEGFLDELHHRACENLALRARVRDLEELLAGELYDPGCPGQMRLDADR